MRHESFAVFFTACISRLCKSFAVSYAAPITDNLFFCLPVIPGLPVIAVACKESTGISKTKGFSDSQALFSNLSKSPLNVSSAFLHFVNTTRQKCWPKKGGNLQDDGRKIRGDPRLKKHDN